MANGDGKFPLKAVYQAAVVLLLLLASFIGARIYGKVDELPDRYVTLKQYDCDTREMKESLKDLNRKIDKLVFRSHE